MAAQETQKPRQTKRAQGTQEPRKAQRVHRTQGPQKAQKPQRFTTRLIARTGMIAAVYAALTILALTLLQGLAWGPIQLRISEAVCVLALLTRAGIPGLTIGCIIANLVGIALTGSGALGLLDVVCGSLATFLGAFWAWKLRERPNIALLGPVIANALIVAAYLPLMLAAYGFYTVPFTEISLVDSYPLMYFFGVVAIGIGEAIVVYALGLPLLKALKKLNIFAEER